MSKIRLNIQAKGFTLIELIVTIIILGILAAYALPNINLANFRSQGFVQQATATIRFGQKLAITTGCNVEVEIDEIDNEICELKWNGCAGNANINNPATGRENFCFDSTSVGAVPVVNFSFSNIGAPIGGLQIINFGGGRTVRVEANTGFVNEL